MITRDGTKPIPSTRSIGYRVNIKVSVSPKNPMPIPSTFRYHFDTLQQFSRLATKYTHAQCSGRTRQHSRIDCVCLLRSDQYNNIQ